MNAGYTTQILMITPPPSPSLRVSNSSNCSSVVAGGYHIWPVNGEAGVHYENNPIHLWHLGGEGIPWLLIVALQTVQYHLNNSDVTISPITPPKQNKITSSTIHPSRTTLHVDQVSVSALLALEERLNRLSYRAGFNYTVRKCTAAAKM